MLPEGEMKVINRNVHSSLKQQSEKCFSWAGLIRSIFSRLYPVDDLCAKFIFADFEQVFACWVPYHLAEKYTCSKSTK